MKRIVLVFVVLLCCVISGCNGLAGQLTKGLYISAWYATYDAERGYQSFSDNIRLFNEINPVWYNLNPAYTATGAPPFVANLQNQDAILSIARNNGVKVLPTIQNFGDTGFDPTMVDSIIEDPTARSRHVTEIVNLVLTNHYDGIDIDYESMPVSVQSYFSSFIGELGSALRQHQKLLSVTVYAKTSDSTNWAGPGAEDWTALASGVDSLKVMAYDYHWSTFHAGPISPLDWLQDILNYARTIPQAKGKIIVGLPFYGLNWGGNASAKEVMYNEAMHIISQNAVENYNRYSIQHSDPVCSYYWKNVEMHFEYNSTGVTHTVYYQDREAFRERLAIINQYRDIIKGVTFWRLGGEDPGIWQEIGSFK
jgi:spore germination protein YaaH